jgi:hypothetical protein
MTSFGDRAVRSFASVDFELDRSIAVWLVWKNRKNVIAVCFDGKRAYGMWCDLGEKFLSNLR